MLKTISSLKQKNICKAIYTMKQGKSIIYLKL